ncbi:hypothetical protein P5673_001962 [Acropora cervicornis]|uniref:Uncharacterized protein n=1 Tax=Acropora cervicornis TaxID=6130 RepID=A0AAD9R551_ACRCE|nr:hypothetical protein P5673_001962 [Acropora cervicornis]
MLYFDAMASNADHNIFLLTSTSSSSVCSITTKTHELKDQSSRNPRVRKITFLCNGSISDTLKLCKHRSCKCIEVLYFHAVRRLLNEGKQREKYSPNDSLGFFSHKQMTTVSLMTWSCASCLLTITSGAKPWYPVFIPHDKL